jgi:hypothetical protein
MTVRALEAALAFLAVGWMAAVIMAAILKNLTP